MGCTSQSTEIAIAPWSGPGLRKERYCGVPYGQGKIDFDQFNMAVSWFSMFGGRFMERERIEKDRQATKEYYVGKDGKSGLLNDPKSAFQKFQKQCDFKKFTIPGHKDFPTIDVFEVRAKANKDATDLIPVVHFHGGAAVMSDPEYDNAFCSRFCVENKLVMFSCRYRLAPEV